MKHKVMGVCLGCGAEFVKTRPDRRYCSRRCTQKFANKAYVERRKESIAKGGTDCPYNREVVCYERKCGSCGWNPKVAQMRSEKLRYERKGAMA